MPFQRTKARYIELEVKARWAHANPHPSRPLMQRESNARWAAMTAVQKALFVDRLNRIDSLRRTAERLEQDAQGFANEGHAYAGHGAWTNFASQIGEYNTSAQRWQAAEEVWESVAERMRRFRNTTVPNLYGPVALEVQDYIGRQILNDIPPKKNACRLHKVAMQNIAMMPPGLPPRQDGLWKMAGTWINIWRRRRWRRAKRSHFRHGDPILQTHVGGNWMGAWLFPQGGQGATGLWVALDQDQNVIHRVVEKQAFLNQKEWASCVFFGTDVANATTRRPLEVACHRALHMVPSQRGRIGRVNVPRMPYWDVNNDEHWYRVSMEYCTNGDLDQIIDHYQTHGVRIPEPFVWRVLDSLAMVGFAMQYGHTNVARRQPVQGWTEIVHRDWKPANIFLTTPTENWFRAYPTPMVGDFGASIRTKQGDNLNPNIYTDGIMTPGFDAPEQSSYVDAQTLRPINSHPMLAHTNVYGVGMVIYALVCLDALPHERNCLGDEQHDVLNVYNDAMFGYSEELLHTVDGCVRLDPTTRPSFAWILNQVDNAIISNLDQGMSVMTAAAYGMLPPADHRRLQGIPNDPWQRGTHINMLPVLPP